MSILLIYFLVVLVLVGVSLIVIFNLVRYRYKGDHTLLFVLFFVFAFIATISLTLALLDYGALALLA